MYSKKNLTIEHIFYFERGKSLWEMKPNIDKNQSKVIWIENLKDKLEIHNNKFNWKYFYSKQHRKDMYNLKYFWKINHIFFLTIKYSNIFSFCTYFSTLLSNYNL